MSLEAAKCPSCGANISAENSLASGVCEYCGSAYVTRQAIDRFHTAYRPPQHPGGPAGGQNYYAPPPNRPQYGNSPYQPYPPNIQYPPPIIPKRPRIHWIIAFPLLCFWMLPGLVYIFAVLNEQKEWDRRYGRRYK